MNNVYVEHFIERNDFSIEQKELLLNAGLRISPFVIPLYFTNQLNQLEFFKSISKRIEPRLEELINPFVSSKVAELARQFERVTLALKDDIANHPSYFNNFNIHHPPFLIRGKVWTSLEGINKFYDDNRSLLVEFAEIKQQIIQSVPLLSTIRIVKYQTIDVLPVEKDFTTNKKEQGRIRKLISNYHNEYASLI